MPTKDGILIIPGQTPSKKNNKQVFHKGGRTIVISSKKHAEWHKSATEALKDVIPTRLRGVSGKVTINYMFYVRDLRRRDTSNMLESINDLLCDLGVLEDDDWQHLRIGSADSELDRENPRCEIIIKPDRR